MLNRRGNSDNNLHRFKDDKESNEKKLSSFLPEFLVKKIAKDDHNPDNKQSVFLEDENEEEGLQINMDHYIINEKTNNATPILSIGSSFSNSGKGNIPMKKSHSQKQVTNFNDFNEEPIDFSQIQSYNPRQNFQQKPNPPQNFQQMGSQQMHFPQNYNQFHPPQGQFMNPNFNYNQQFNGYGGQFPMNNNMNFNNNFNNFPPNNFYPPNNFQNFPNQTQNGSYSPNHFQQNNFGKFYPPQQRTQSPNPYGNFMDMSSIHNISNNMSQLNLNNTHLRHNSNSSQNHDPFFNFDNPGPDSLNTSTNNSVDDSNHNFFPIRAPPKKTFSDSNLKIAKKNPDQMKSLFKDKIDNTGSTEEINLTEVLANPQFDLPEFIKTQKGSRVMQKELNSISPENLENLLKRLCPNLTTIMIDTYGNYFSQKLIQCCSPQQRLQILKSIVKDFVMISCHNSGTHSVQCLMEIINLKEEEEIIKESIKNDILTLSYDVNATHVMQKIIAIIEEKDRDYINVVLLDNLLKLVFDANGICVIKRMINGNKDLNIRNRILGMIQKNCLEIIQNPFGNYIIQHILEEWGPEICKDVTKHIHQNIISLSMQKFSSNVVEKCMDLIDEPSRKLWIKDIFNFSKISSLLKNKYGNFVLQKAIMIMTTEEKKEIKEYLLKKLSLISNKEKARLKGLIDIIN